MIKENITRIWDEINHSGKGELEYQLLSKDIIPNLNLGLTLNNQRCLVLELPQGYTREFRQFEGGNLSLKFFSSERCICIILNDEFFNDLFDDLIISIYEKIKDRNEPEEYTNTFISYFYKWSSFFYKPKDSRLSQEEVQGLFGELIFLRNQISKSTKANINLILNSWKGPYDSGHDFEFELIDYEIKTIFEGVNVLKISSEYQLEAEKGKNIELKVILIEPDIQNGLSIKDLTNEIKAIIYQYSGELTPFIMALAQKGLNFINVEEYDIYRFKPSREITYRCNEEGFPKIIRSNLKNQITKVKYQISLSLISEYIKEELKY